VAGSRVPASRSAAGRRPADEDDTTRARAAASRHMLERARAQAKAHADRIAAAEGGGSSPSAAQQFKAMLRGPAAVAAQPTGRGGGAWAEPTPAPAQAIVPGPEDEGWVGVGLQRLEADKAAEARIEARIRQHRIRRAEADGGEKPLPELAPTVLRTFGHGLSPRPGLPERAAAAEAPRRAPGKGRGSMKRAAAAYGAAPVGRRKKSKAKRRPRGEQPSIALL